MIDEQAREKKLLAMARRKARVIVEIKWLLKRRGIKVKGHDDLKELHLPEIDRRLREIDGTVEFNNY
jgi:hypothetical protein